MNWSKEWSVPQSAKQLADEQAKAAKDAIMFGTGVTVTHIPLESFIDLQTIIVKNGQKQSIIPVTIIGDLALDFEDGSGWNIYHVPTLSLFSSVVPAADLIYAKNDEVDGEYKYDKQPLLNWMKKVQENYPTSWQMLRCLTPDNYADSGQSAKDIIKKWCLSVKVE